MNTAVPVTSPVPASAPAPTPITMTAAIATDVWIRPRAASVYRAAIGITTSGPSTLLSR
ncbi:hypothetical protein ACFYVC_12765 [Streptomyces tendae]|uniref:hypothetical protein n=1 Tax=Streptomyces tendae TaxID=1932 RepID=UPI0036D12258